MAHSLLTLLARKLPLVRLSVFVLVASVSAQTCYWPNGNIIDSTNGLPCTSEFASQHLGSSNNQNTCCPLNWMCLPTGICSNPSANSPDSSDGVLYDRTGCTDESWETCPQICTGSGTGQGGNEGILRCGEASACCNRNMQSGDCCNGDIAGSPQFVLAFDGSSGSTSSGGGTGTSTTGASGSTMSSTTMTGQSGTATTLSSSMSTRPGTGTSQVISTPRVSSTLPLMSAPSTPGSVTGGSSASNTQGANTPTPTTSVSASSSAGLSSGATAGIAIGIVAGLALLGFLIWFFVFRKRRDRSDHGSTHGVDGQDHRVGGLGVVVSGWRRDKKNGVNGANAYNEGLEASHVEKSETRPATGPVEMDGSPPTWYSPRSEMTMDKSARTSQPTWHSSPRSELSGDSPRLGTAYNPAELEQMNPV